MNFLFLILELVSLSINYFQQHLLIIRFLRLIARFLHHTFDSRKVWFLWTYTTNILPHRLHRWYIQIAPIFLYLHFGYSFSVTFYGQRLYGGDALGVEVYEAWRASVQVDGIVLADQFLVDEGVDVGVDLTFPTFFIPIFISQYTLPFPFTSQRPITIISLWRIHFLLLFQYRLHYRFNLMILM